MQKYLFAVGLVLMMLVTTLTYSYSINRFPFTSPIAQQRFNGLLSELRCLVCQNQSLAESNAPLALDLKQHIYEQINIGATDGQIKTYLVQRYGEFILFKPAFNHITLVLWLGPVIFLCGSLAILSLSIRQKTRRGAEE